MLSKQVANSDILSLLGASAKGSGASQNASEGPLGEFAQLLKTEGSLNDISPDQLMSLFINNKGEGSEALTNELMQKLSTPEGQELLQSLSLKDGSFSNAQGELLSPDALLQKLAKVQEGKTLAATNELGGNTQAGELSGKSELGEGLPQKPFSDKFPSITQKRSMKNDAMAGLNRKTPDVQSAEDFLAQRRALFGKGHVQMANGKPTLKTPGVTKYHKESIMTDNRIIRSKGLEGGEPQVESQSDFQMSEVFEGGAENQLEVQGLQVSKNSNGQEMKMASKNQILDLSHVDANNKTELINKISNYIEQSYVSGQDSLEMIVKHDDLGQFKVSANRVGAGQQIDLQISTMTEKGHQFFMENESELIKSLTRNGVKISDMKVTNGQEFFNLAEGRSQMSDNNSSQSQGRGEYQSQGQNFGENGQENSRQERRRQLWQNAREQFMNYQAA